MTTSHRVLFLEDHHRRTGPEGDPDQVAAALAWAMPPADRAAWRALVAHYEVRLGTHPATVSPGDLDPADLEAATAIFRRAYGRLGWPVRD